MKKSEKIRQGLYNVGFIGDENERNFGKVGKTTPVALFLSNDFAMRSDREGAPRPVLTWRWVRIRQKKGRTIESS
jgi:hypothetical protein